MWFRLSLHRQNYSSFWCMQVASGSTYAFVGAFNKIPTAVLGHFLFTSALTRIGWMGVLLGLVAGVGYARARARQNQKLKN